MGVVAWCMSVDETWFVGPLAMLIGDGSDIANEFTFVRSNCVGLPTGSSSGVQILWTLIEVPTSA
jgi:hypothetical protein